jgi:hypothetical protein
LGLAVDGWQGRDWGQLFMVNASIDAMEHVMVIDTAVYDSENENA